MKLSLSYTIQKEFDLPDLTEDSDDDVIDAAVAAKTTEVTTALEADGWGVDLTGSEELFDEDEEDADEEE